MRNFGLADIDSVNEDGKRYYKTPDGKFPSVTTVLSLEAKEGLEKWKQRVGEENAEKIKLRAADRGNEIHRMMEDYVIGRPVTALTPWHRSLFNPLRDHLANNMREPWCVEAALYSSKLKVAGRTDLIGLFDEGPEIVDFKGSNGEKKEEYVQGYRMQACCYAYMFKERTGISINKYRILVVDEFANLQVFAGNTSDHIVPFAKLRKEFHNIYGV